MSTIDDVNMDALKKGFHRIVANGYDRFVDKYDQSLAPKVLADTNKDWCYIEEVNQSGNVTTIKKVKTPPDLPLANYIIDFEKPYGYDFTQKGGKIDFNRIKDRVIKPKDSGKDTSRIWRLIMELENGDWIADWICQALQNPERKYPTALVIQGKQGTGKGTIFNNLLNRVCRPGTCLNTASDPFNNRFNHSLEGLLFLNLDEGAWEPKHQSVQVIKNFISEKYLSVEKKFKDRYTVRNYARLILTANHDRPIEAENGDRRFCISRMDDTRGGPGGQFWKDINADIEDDDTIAQFLWEALHRPITHDLNVAPMSEAKRELIVNSRWGFTGWLEDQLDDCVDGCSPMGWNTTSIMTPDNKKITTVEIYHTTMRDQFNQDNPRSSPITSNQMLSHKVITWSKKSNWKVEIIKEWKSQSRKFYFVQESENFNTKPGSSSKPPNSLEIDHLLKIGQFEFLKTKSVKKGPIFNGFNFIK